MKKIIKWMCMTLFVLFAASQNVEAADYEFNNIEIGKTYTIDSLTDDWGYILETEIPEDGHIRIWINDYTSDIYRSWLLISSEGSAEWDDIESWETRHWVKSTESMHSGWITVNQGTYYSRFYADGIANREANVYIEFESNATYYGEKEDNDTFDEATEIILGEEYEGNYSKADDEDYYKFVLEAPGLIEISSTNIREDKLMQYCIYEEDENLNVYEIYYNYNISESSHDVADRLRLPAGTYYMYLELWHMDPEYTIKVKYTAESPEQYEQEYNNISKHANEILPREKYTGNLNTIEDVDYYKFYVPRKSYVTLCSWIPRQIGDKLLVITLYDEDLKQMTSLTTSKNAYETSKKVLVDMGYYYIRVRDCDEYVYASLDTLDNIYDYSVKADVKCYKHLFETKIVRVATTKRDGLRHCTCEVCGHEEEQLIRRIGEVKLSSINYTYNGKTKSPSVYIKDSKGNKISTSNYTISKPAERKNVGKYTYKITFKNEYSGTKSLTFTISPKRTSIAKVTGAKKAVTVKWKKQSEKMAISRITGYEVQYSTSKKFTKPKSKMVSRYSATSKKITGLKAKKTYYVRVRTYKTVKVNGKTVKLYSNWSQIKSIKTK